jgi:MoaA/NifB/PqqE/SkfB family radical SAM enzyme
VTSPLPEFINHVVTGDSVYDLQLDGTKISWWRDRVEAWKRGEKIAPVTMDVALTRQCNAACEFCYATLQASDGHKIEQHHAFAFFEDAAAIGVKGMSLISDGESTVVPWYEEAVEKMHEVGLKVGVGTNGVRLKEPVLRKILPHLSYLRFNFSAGELERYKQIMGLKERDWWQVLANIKAAMKIKRELNLPLSINVQMVVMPEYEDQILPLARLCRDELRPDYLIFKHCADDVDGHLGVDYSKYSRCFPTFLEAESYADETFRVVTKWSRIEREGKRDYSRCFGPPFIMQMSGNGLIAPCGFLFNREYAAFHIGNIVEKRFRDIWASERWDEVMGYLASEHFNPQERCGPNCLQHNTNDWLFRHVQGNAPFAISPPPRDLEFL